MEYKVIEGGGITSPKGFTAGAVYVGVKSRKTQKPDVAVLYSETEASCAAVFTTNKFCAAPVILDREILKNGKARAIVINSGNANAATGTQGIEDARTVEREAEKLLGVGENEVFVCSTGVIGQKLPVEKVLDGVRQIIPAKLDKANGSDAAYATMPTDTVRNEYAYEPELSSGTIRIGAMAKGSGMIHPNMATTLNCITTDAAVPAELLQKALSDVVKVTYNCLSVDGDQSTNDTCLLMASGAAGNPEVAADSAEYTVFRNALYCVMMNLTRMLAYDGEGATKLLECKVSGAKDLDTAIVVAKSVVCSPLLKCAMFGADANWGRVLCAVGYAPAEFDINQVAVTLASRAGSVDVCRNGAGIEFSEDIAKKVLLEDEIEILVSIGDGPAAATAWGCDLTYDYVKINGDYRS